MPSFHSLPSIRENLRYTASGRLTFEGVDLVECARKAGTPLWVTGAGTLRSRVRRLQKSLKKVGTPIHIHYAVKAADHQTILALMAQEGLGADIVSGGELIRAMKAGIPAEKIVFSGVGKTNAELEQAVATHIGQINAESADELRRLNRIAARNGRSVRIALRVNPEIAAGGHAKISTGRKEDKFGVSLTELSALLREIQEDLPALVFSGIAVHAGSQITKTEEFRVLYSRIAEIVRSLRQQGFAIPALDCGGGLGVPYGNEKALDLEVWATLVKEILAPLNMPLHFEPGRWISAPAGLLLAEIIVKKGSAGEPMLILDAGMNDLARPALYGARHQILPLMLQTGAPLQKTSVFGPVCESSDEFGRAYPLPASLKAGDFVAFLDAGAYGSVMSSTYNSRPLAAQIIVENGRWEIIRPRQTIGELMAAERIPDWL